MKPLNSTHYVGDECEGGHYGLPACPTCAADERDQKVNEGMYGVRCKDLWHEKRKP